VGGVNDLKKLRSEAEQFLPYAKERIKL